MIYPAISIFFLALGAYLFLLGIGRVESPKRFKNSDQTTIAGRALLFLGALLTPTFFGITPTQILAWLADIWTTGGGGGAG